MLLVYLTLATLFISATDASSFSHHEVAAKIKTAMNESVQPCEDFYSYACGGWQANHPVPAHRSKVNQFGLLQEKMRRRLRTVLESRETPSSRTKRMAKAFYAACLNFEETQKQSFTEHIKQEILTPNNDLKVRAGKSTLVAELMLKARYYGSCIFVCDTIEVDKKEPTRWILNLSPAGLILGAEKFYMRPEKYPEKVRAYKEWLTEALAHFGIIKRTNLVQTRPETKLVERIFKLERNLASIRLPPEQRRNLTAHYYMVTIRQLQALSPQVDWIRYICTLTEDCVGSIGGFPRIETVNVGDRDYMKRLTEIFSDTEKDLLKIYTLIKVVNKATLRLPEKFVQIAQQRKKALSGISEELPRWESCVDVTSSKLMFALTALYLDNYQSPDKNRLRALYNGIVDEFKKMLKNNKWMDDYAKQEAVKKLRNLIPHLIYPEWVRNGKNLDEYYEKLEIDFKDGYDVAISKVDEFQRRRWLSLLLQRVDRWDYPLNPLTSNAHYMPSLNSLVVDMGMLFPPIYNEKLPMWSNFASVGAIIGHEITHAFDDSGHLLDSESRLREWWSSTTNKSFIRKTLCIVQQYNSQTVPETKTTINGRTTLGENIADNGALKLAYRAAKSFARDHGEELIPELFPLTHDQLFFIAYAQKGCANVRSEQLQTNLLADPHTPNKFRINLVLQNQPEFAEAFFCPVNTPMNPRHKCHVW